MHEVAVEDEIETRIWIALGIQNTPDRERTIHAIDRYGFDKYLPFYRYGDICIWDFVVLAAVVASFIVQSRSGPRD